LKLLITIEGKSYEVEVEILEEDAAHEEPPHRLANLDSAAAAPAHHYGGAWDGAGAVCRSPLSGLVIKVHSAPGQKVKAGDLLIVLEAMKMETNVTAPRDGIVKTLPIAQGDSVKLNQVLLELG